MSTDYAEMERDFVASLKEDTGRDLAAWMIAIRDCEHSDRNAIIDWLRHQGFQFSWASWLERIHHNGGRLIYGEGEARAALTERTTLPGRPALLERPALPERTAAPELRHPSGPSTPETAPESAAENAAAATDGAATAKVPGFFGVLVGRMIWSRHQVRC